MMKRYRILLPLLLLCLLTTGATRGIFHHSGPPSGSVITSFTCAQASTRLSLASGATFADCTSATLSQFAGNYVVTIADTTSKTLVSSGTLTPGTAETLGGELITVSDDRTFLSDTGFWTKGANWSIGSGVATAANSSAYFYRAALGTVGWLAKAVGTYTISLGGLSVVYGTGEPATSAGVARVGYGTFAVSGNFGWKATGSTNATLDDVSLKQVLTPSATGVVVGGWTETTGFNRNDTSYTFTVSYP